MAMMVLHGYFRAVGGANDDLMIIGNDMLLNLMIVLRTGTDGQSTTEGTIHTKATTREIQDTKTLATQRSSIP